MYFIVVLFTIATACSLICTKTLLGYNNVSYIWKLLLFAVLWLSWLSPVVMFTIRRQLLWDGKLYNSLSFLGYGLFGFAFILFMLIFCRDILWYLGYGISKIFVADNSVFNPKNIIVLTRANIITVILAVSLSMYSIYQGIKPPKLHEVVLHSPKISEEITIVQINDMHMDRAKPTSWFKNMVDKANVVDPDIIVLPGDIIDDNVDAIPNHISLLADLKAKHGVYFSIGNHEFYNGYLTINQELEKIGIKVLNGTGELVFNNIFLAGVPDVPLTRNKVSYPNILDDINTNFYKILLAHNPTHADDYIGLGFDLQLSAHTHGGQIFPFHIPTKYVNHYLAGLYKINDGHLYISRGAGYWGPPMRLLAPSDITVIKLVPKK